MEHNDPEKLARELEREADELEQRSEAVGKQMISDVRQDRRQREDSVAPGAASPEDEDPRDAEPAA